LDGKLKVLNEEGKEEFLFVEEYQNYDKRI